MPGSEQFTPPQWNESDSFRETTLHLFKRKDRRAIRRLGRLLYDMVIFDSHLGLDAESSITRAELRAAAADLRYTGGYLLNTRRSAEECDLAPADDELAHLAGRLGRKVLALAEKIEQRLGAPQPAARPATKEGA